MDARWQRLEEIFDAAAELSEPERAALLDRACAGDEDLRREVESLLAHDLAGDRFIEAAVAAAVPETLTMPGTSPQTAISDGGPLPGRIGPYRIVREIGSGGMGLVYEGIREDEFKKRVALKIIKRGMDTASVVLRFHRERQILAGLNHPNITGLLDGGTTPDGRPYFVMEYVEGEPIVDYCDVRKLTIRQRLEMFRVICAAVQYAHQNLVVHRDLKPSNILVTSDGVPKLLDFGIAKILNIGVTSGTMGLTVASMRVMTPEYASPEQVRGEPITTSTDVYSLGVLLYELLTGHHPYRFKTATPQEIERVICQQPPEKPSVVVTRAEQQPGERVGRQVLTPQAVSATREGSPEQLRKRLTGDLDNILLKALQKEPDRRYPSVEQFSEDIRRHVTGLPVLARNDTMAYRTGKFVSRHKVGVFAVVAVAFALIAGVIVSSWQAMRARRAEQVAITESATAKAVNDFLQNDLLAQASAYQQSKPNTRPDPDLKVRSALDSAAARIEGKFGGQPLVEASIRETIGSTYLELGLYPAAQRQVERALELRRRLLGEQHADTLTSMSDLVRIERVQGDYARAEQLGAKVLEGRRRLLGAEHPDTLKSTGALAAIYYFESKYAPAEALELKMLEAARRVWGEDHPNTVAVMTDLAATYKREGKYSQAEPLFIRGLELRRRISGQEHPETLVVMNNLAGLYYEEGKYAQAEPLWASALDIRRRIFGEEHPDTLQSRNNMALLCVAQGKYDQAQQLYQGTLEIRRRISGTGNISTLILMNNLADLYRLEGKYARAEALFNEALKAGRHALGDEHETTLNSLTGLADIYKRQGRYALAESIYTNVLTSQRRALGDVHPDTISTFASLGHVRLLQRKYNEAEAPLRYGLQMYEKSKPDSWERYSCQSMLGASLAGQKKFSEAEPLLISGYEGIVRLEPTMPMAERSNLRDARERLIHVYREWGKLEKLAEWEAKFKAGA
jgi:eukaryotic-like serine/threonine-protein kinase